MRIYWAILLTAILLAVAPVHAAEKWAVLIGIGDYIRGTRMDLEGPPNDVQMMEELLLSKFGYEVDHIKKLVDWEATKENIIRSMNWLQQRAKPEDTVLFYYSGHGSQVYDQNGDEEDGKDEVLCPADISVYVPGNEISDDKLAALLEQIEAADITVIFDACHAGTGTRTMEFGESVRDTEVRALQLEYPEPKDRERTRSLSDAPADGMDMVPGGGSTAGTRAMAGRRRSFTMIASCAPHETSASTVFSEGLTRFWSGILTYNLVNAFKRADGKTSYADLMASVLRDVKRIARDQTPQIEGDVDRPIFSNTSGTLTPRDYVRVIRVKGREVRMRSSSFGRDRPGSIYKIISPKTGEPIGRVKVTRTWGQNIRAEIIEGEGRIQAPALAVEEYHALSTEKLHVKLSDFGDKRVNQAMRYRLGKIDFIHVVENDTSYFDQVLTGRIEGSVLSLLTGYKVTAYLEEAGVRSREVTSVNVDEIIGVLRPLLENAYAIKKLSRMDNASSPFKVSVWATNTPDPGKKKVKFSEMKVGDPIYFHFRSDKNAYLTLLNVDSKGTITILYPNEYIPHNRVIADKAYTIPTEEMGFQLHLGGPPGQELVKAFATEFPLDLSALNTQKVGGFRAFEFEGEDREYGPSVVDGLMSAIRGNFNRHMASGTRAIVLSGPTTQEGPPLGVPTENWSTDYLIVDAH